MKVNLLPERRLKSTEQDFLEKQLRIFYENATDYEAFNEISDQSNCWNNILPEIINKLKRQEKVRILEIGAGRSGFGKFLSRHNIRSDVYWIAQDVTTQNKSWLKTESNEVYIGHIEELLSNRKFDIIFSTFVFEHVTNPNMHLEKLNSLLNDDGSIYIFCPRYDLPGYLCPSSRHLHFSKKMFFLLKCFFYRLKTLITQQPSFLLQTDLAAFHRPFSRDSDAVHWVSSLDLRFWALNHKLKVINLKFGNPIFFTKDWFVKKWLICAVKIQK
ncbi:MAG: class I SAM-dependent methyltransferase [Bacteroidetes bacterium]|nr:class I SAM-dependent methyltransferase [Bacteroidota bacterium]